MFFSKGFICGAAGIGVIALSACSASSGGGTTTLSSLPAASGPVTGSTSEFTTTAATSGVVLANLGSVSWTSANRAFCEVARKTREAFREAAQPDKIRCYMGAMQAAGILTGTIDDATYKYITLAAGSSGMTFSGNTSPKVKFKITKSGANITNFEMFSCFGGTTASPTQEEYFNVDLSNAAATTMTSVHLKTDSGNTYRGRVSVTGATDGSGGWTSKTLTTQTSSTFTSSGSGSFGEYITFTQGSASMTLNGYRAGSFTSSGGTASSFSDKFAGQVQILGASKMSTFALGDGSVKAQFSNTCTSGCTTFAQTGSTSWNGDTRATLASVTTGDYYSAVNAATLTSTTPAIPTIALATAETWDCTTPAGSTSATATLTADVATEFAACDAKYDFGSGQNNWINCESTTGF